MKQYDILVQTFTSSLVRKQYLKKKKKFQPKNWRIFFVKKWHGPLSHWCRECKTLVVRPLKKILFFYVCLPLGAVTLIMNNFREDYKGENSYAVQSGQACQYGYLISLKWIGFSEFVFKCCFGFYCLLKMGEMDKPFLILQC